MSWGTDLWDQHDRLSNHTNKGIEFVERYGSFLKEKCQIDFEYAKNLRTLVKKYQPTSKRRNCDNDDLQYSSVKAFADILNEMNFVAGQHEMVAETLKTDLLTQIADEVKTLKERRRSNLEEVKRHEAVLNSSINQLLSIEKDYVRAWKDAQVAKEKYQKADEDMNLSRAEVMKAKEYSEKKDRDFDNSKANYAYQLKATNDLKDSHYTTELPAALNKLREMDEGRISLLQGVLNKYIAVECQALPLIGKCYDAMKEYSEKIDPTKDSELVVENFRSGHLPPTDFDFKDMSDPAAANDVIDGDGKVKRKVKDTLKRGKSGRNSIGAIFPVARSSAPQQRCRRLQKRLKELENELTRAVAAKDGVKKLHEAYAKDPRMGDANTVEYKEQQLEREIQSLQGQIAALLTELDKAKGEVNIPINQAPGSGNTTPIHSESRLGGAVNNHSHSTLDSRRFVDQEPRARGSFTSEDSSNDKDGGASNLSTGRSPSEVSGRSSGHYGAGQDCEKIPAIDDDYTLPTESLGTAKVLYEFEGVNEGTISVAEGQVVEWLERDEGDGWTRVRHQNTMGEGGFVPTSYLQFFPA